MIKLASKLEEKEPLNDAGTSLRYSALLHHHHAVLIIIS